MRSEITDGSTLAAQYDPINFHEWAMLLGAIIAFIILCSLWFRVNEMYEYFKIKKEDEEIKKDLEIETNLLNRPK